MKPIVVTLSITLFLVSLVSCKNNAANNKIMAYQIKIDSLLKEFQSLKTKDSTLMIQLDSFKSQANKAQHEKEINEINCSLFAKLNSFHTSALSYLKGYGRDPETLTIKYNDANNFFLANKDSFEKSKDIQEILTLDHDAISKFQSLSSTHDYLRMDLWLEAMKERVKRLNLCK